MWRSQRTTKLNATNFWLQRTPPWCSQLSKFHVARPNQGLSSLTPGDGKMRDPGNEVEGKKPPVSLLEHIFMAWQSFWINTENACKRGYLFWCILHAIYTETSGPTLEKKCCLVRNLTYSLEWNAMKKVCKLLQLEYMKFLVGVSSVTHKPLTFTTPCSAAILPP